MAKRRMSKMRDTLLAAGLGVFVIAFWQLGGLHWLLGLKPYQLPLPSAICTTFAAEFDEIWSNTLWTLTEAVSGILIGSLIGFAIALFATVSPNVGVGGLTVVTAFNAIPMIALASIMNNWFGMGMASKIWVVAVFSMASMALNAYKGMTELPTFSHDLMQSYAASPFTVFIRLRLPNSVPYLLTALKVSTTLGLMSAICSEFFTSYAGIGYRLTTVIKLSNMSLAWSYIAIATICGIVLYSLVSLVERCACKWHASQRI